MMMMIIIIISSSSSSSSSSSIHPLGRFGQRPELSQATDTLHPGQVLRGSLPLLSPACFRCSHFRHQVPRRERS
jgi:hypothetical protein